MSWSRQATTLARAWRTHSPSAAPLQAARTFSSSPSSSSAPSSAQTPAQQQAQAQGQATPTLTRPDLAHPSLAYLRSLASSSSSSSPADTLSAFDPILDVPPSKILSSPAASRTTGQAHDVRAVLFNDAPNNAGYQQPRPSDDLLDGLPGEDDAVAHLASVTQLSAGEIRGLYRFPLVVKRVVTMKSKGKMPSMYALTVVGNGAGLVGVGEGKDETAQKAVQKAFAQAVRSMDAVERYEDRTVWGTMRSNFGTCEVEMRSRPPGFGLRTNPYIHQVAKAAGLSDLSAKVYGSRNPTRVIKLVVGMLHGGKAPLDMGGFASTKGQRRNKKIQQGMESAEAIARGRGRRAVDVSA
ncbi:hypothetical protein JCM6882_002681 [Rhodosporidiobolus microsporus]